MRTMVWCVCVLVGASCAPKGQPVLELSLSPKGVTDATPVQVHVAATKGDGTIGTGTVKITSARGSLTSPVEVPLDGFGTANAELLCDPDSEPECAELVRVVAEWTSEGVDAVAEVRLNSSASTAVGTGTGTGTGIGGGIGGSGAGGGTVVTGACSSLGKPGLRPSCCMNPAPTCGATIINVGDLFSIPFVNQSGIASDLDLRFEGVSNLTTEADCSMLQLKRRTGTLPNMIYMCSEHLIASDGSWTGKQSGGCQTLSIDDYFRSLCRDLLSGSSRAAAHTMARVEYSEGGQFFTQAKPNQIVFMMRK